MPELMPAVVAAAGVVIAIIVAIVITAVIAAVLRVVGRHRSWPADLIARARKPFRITLVLSLVWIALEVTLPGGDWRPAVTLAFRIAFIAAFAWLVASIAIFFEDLGLGRYRVDVPDNRVARRLRTQVLIIRRLTVVIIVVLALGAILLSFPGVEALGASILASAGLISIVAGLAAQSSLANLFAGMQLAFSDAIRMDDVVVVEGEWGRIEEITLTYVVVHLWDDRRLVLPSTWFTTTPFQNWTRRSSELLGSVELDLDWDVPLDDMRAELDRLLADSELWDGRASVLQVTDAVGGYVRVRVLVTAVDAPTLFDLRCDVREGLVTWLRSIGSVGVPRGRVALVSDTAESDARGDRAAQPDAGQRRPRESVGLFTGDERAIERAGQLTGTIPIQTARDDESADGPWDADR
ncbi:mechanosensitive ion channel family protein [Marisediminicola sp. LYQ134]|uniref:mechanosensitive ion channel family protein n=1 Tax=unclassified Marisediminicola TaxID=2618316 RepID=UPI00398315B0